MVRPVLLGQTVEVMLPALALQDTRVEKEELEHAVMILTIKAAVAAVVPEVPETVEVAKMVRLKIVAF